MRNKQVFLSGFLAVLVGLVFVSMAVTGLAAQDAEPTVIVVEIAEDPTRLVFDGEALFDDGMPQYGNEFISQGYIYPAGTLNGTNGVLEDGSPEFPDKVIGEWTCRGWHIGDGGHTTEGFWAMTTQTFLFYDGDVTIVTDGYESPTLHEPVARAIVGGTGMYMGARGEQVQRMMGFTEYSSINVHVELTVLN